MSDQQEPSFMSDQQEPTFHFGHTLAVYVSALGLLLCGLIGMGAAAARQGGGGWSGPLWLLASVIAFYAMTKVFRRR